ncbi:hypothetical protein SKAU_G00417560 [Synaphobranchus kaupii]|uniref:Uncharacterized protein n=1 Tax=Synaphobranchus kaupii TaxID=118154 RepID=A0A9Q1E678_SYNKA|nr:hypothetical protein SKAU_G00417560 [Synaphobranchus kaupii]
MVTNDSALGVTFRYEAAGQHLNSERKSEEGWIPVVFVLVSFLPPLLIGICCKMKSNPKCCPRALHVEGQGGQSDLNATPLLPLPSTVAGPPPSNGYNRDCNGDSSDDIGTTISSLTSVST